MRLCLKIEDVSSVENETLDDVLDKVKSLIMESGNEIPDVIDRAHQIGKGYKDKTWNIPSKIIIVRFSIFRHKTLFCWNRNKLKNYETLVRSDKEMVEDIYRCCWLCESIQKYWTCNGWY